MTIKLSEPIILRMYQTFNGVSSYVEVNQSFPQICTIEAAKQAIKDAREDAAKMVEDKFVFVGEEFIVSDEIRKLKEQL